MIKNFFFFLLSTTAIVCSTFLNNPVFAQDVESWSALTWQEDKCLTGKYSIVSDDFFKIGTSADFSLSMLNTTEPTWIVVNYQIKKWETVMLEQQGKNYTHVFKNPWNFEIVAKIRETSGCNYEVKKSFSVFEHIVSYLGENINELTLWINLNLQTKNALFYPIIIEKGGLFSEDEYTQLLTNNSNLLQHSDKIIVHGASLTSIFDSLAKVSKVYNLKIADKQIIVLIDWNENLLRTLLTKYFRIMWVDKFYLLERKDFLNYITAIDFKTDNGDDFTKVFTISFDDVSKVFFLSYIVDFLLFAWFPASFIGLFLSLTIGALVISVCRQVIGFSVFWVFYPLIFALAMAVLWMQLSFLLLFIWFFATLLTNLFINKIYLLNSAKLTMLTIFYVLFWLIVLWADRFFQLWLVDFSVFTNAFIIFPIFFLIIISNKVFQDNFNLFSKGWWVSFLEFIVVSSLVFFLLIWNNFQLFLISYPEILFLVLILTVLVWRFTWLLLVEYLRFMPLLKKKEIEEE